MKHPSHGLLTLCLLLAALAATPLVRTSETPANTPIKVGSFGPTGVEVTIEPDLSVTVTGIEKGSPAEGKITAGEIISAVNGQVPVHKPADATEPFWPFKQLAAFIDRAEATDGILKFTVQPAKGGQAREETIAVPVLGSYDPRTFWDCDKARKIVRMNADFIAAKVNADPGKFTEHNLYNGFAILMLLSTGEQTELDTVRKIYQARMAGFHDTDTGPHSWHNGVQGIAACEYYLRTGDETVIPLIDAICESARKYQVNGGWTHWAQGVNPQYTAGGLMNPAGTQLCTTLIMARQCGAKVNEKTLVDAVTYFYRFAGHGNNPYGDHRPESGLGSNGKTEMLALAMGEAARAKDGSAYARARDAAALSALYDYPWMLAGHTGPYGSLWHGIAAALMCDKRPELFANRFHELQWFYDLSLHFDGSFGAAGAERYDDPQFAYAVGIAFTAPRKTLQITGAPTSPYAKPFTLPERPWGRASDLDFLNIDGGPAYQGSNDAPHIELKKIPDADENALRRLAAHPIFGFRQATAAALRDKKLLGLIEELLGSDDPFSRQTACMAINAYEPWQLRFSIGTRAGQSLSPDQFSQRMFDGLVKIINDPQQPLENVNWALLAMACATQQQIESHLSDLLPWLHHPEWWLNESACIALTPAMKNKETLAKMLPDLIDAVATNMHARPRTTMPYMMNKAVAEAPADVKEMMTRAHIDIYRKTPSVPNPEPGVDFSGITSCALEGTMSDILNGDPQAVLEGARLSVHRIHEMRPREMGNVIDNLIAKGEPLDEPLQREIGAILVKHFRPMVIGDDPAALKAQMSTGTAGLEQLNKLLAIDRMAGLPGGWAILGNDPAGKQQWWYTSVEPASKPYDSEMNRYRKIELPAALADFSKPEYDPAANGWKHQEGSIGGSTPEGYPYGSSWLQTDLADAGEVILLRKTVELKDLDFAVLRLTVYSRQGYDVYLNGKLLKTNQGRSKTWGAQRIYFDQKMRSLLEVGPNVIALRGFMQYFKGKEGGIDVYLEGLRQLPSLEK